MNTLVLTLVLFLGSIGAGLAVCAAGLIVTLLSTVHPALGVLFVLFCLCGIMAVMIKGAR